MNVQMFPMTSYLVTSKKDMFLVFDFILHFMWFWSITYFFLFDDTIMLETDTRNKILMSEFWFKINK